VDRRDMKQIAESEEKDNFMIVVEDDNDTDNY
jgi:hypothetical protein